MRSAIWRGVGIQVSVFTAVITALLSYPIFMVQYKITYRDILRSLNDQAEHIYTYIGEHFEPDTFKHVSTRKDVLKENYTKIYDRFQRAGEITGVMYLYTTRMDENEKFVYVIDYLDPRAEDFKCPGNPVKREVYPNTEHAMQGEIVMLEEIKKTDWGKIFITYMPIYEGDEAIRVIGIGFGADHQYKTYQNLRRALPMFILLSSLIVCLVPRFLFRCISNPFYKDMSNMDYLTQLKSRNAYQLDMNNPEAKKMESGIGFILIDLNSLKHTNGTLGHGVGDRYITCMSKVYLNTHAGEGVMYRIGGNEFVMMMSRATQIGIENFTARLRREFGKLTFRPEFTFSWGSAVFDEKADDNLLSICRRVDKNMYMRKQKYYEDKKT